MTDDAASRRRGGFLGAGVAAAAALVVYLAVGGVASHGFLNYDDVYVVSNENVVIAKGLVRGLPELMDPTAKPRLIGEWLPFYAWSLGLDHALGGAAWIFHVHSALLHALGAALVALIARRLGADGFVAGLAGVIFAVHPVATESVAWVASRKDVLSFVWMAFAALCYLRGVERLKPAWHLVGALCLAVALLAKGTTLVLPLLLAAHAVLLRRGASLRERLGAVVPYAVVTVGIVGVHLWVAMSERTALGAAEAGLGARLLDFARASAHYVVALVAPVRLSVEHDVAHDGPAWAFVGVVALLVGAGTFAATRRGAPAVAVAVLAVALALAPFNNVFPRTNVLFAERYAYIALLPFSIGLAWALRPRGDGAASLLPAAVGVGALATLCVLRLPVWRDSISLWQDAATKSPRSAFVQSQLADAYGTAGRAGGPRAAEFEGRSISAWRSAKALAETENQRVRAESGLATQLFLTAGSSQDPAGQVRDAVADFESAEKRAQTLDAPGVKQKRVEILCNLATCRELLGQKGAALDAWETAVRLDDKCAIAWNALARIHVGAGLEREAREALAKSEKAAPHDPAIVRERARVRLAAGDAAGAKRDLADAIEANPRDAELLLEAARLDLMWLRPVDAETKFRRALALRPDDDAIRDLLAASLLAQAEAQAARDDMKAAEEAARKAGEVAPRSSAPEQLLGIVARRAGDLEGASRHLRKARELQPESARVKELLASALVEQAAKLLDEKRDGVALMLLEEAVQTHAALLTTPKARLDTGVGDWPPPVKGDDRAAVARDAALKGLAWLAVARPADALTELTLADAALADADAKTRREVLRLLVRARFANGRGDEAVAAAQRLPTLEIPDDPTWAWKRHAEIASAYVERGTGRRGARDVAGAAEDFAAARAALERASAAGMPESKARTRVGEILFREQDFLAATKEFDKAEQASPDDVEPVLDRARVWLTEFLIEEDRAYLVAAEHDFRRAQEIAPSDARVLAGLGETLVLGQKPAEAFPLLTKAVLADPSQVGARKMLADLAVRAGRSRLEKASGRPASEVQTELADARSAAERAVALDAPSPDALVFLGEVQTRQGDWAAALASYEKARARFPDSTLPLDAIAKHHLDRGNLFRILRKLPEAVVEFRKSLDVEKTTLDLTPARERLHEIAVLAFGEAVDLDKQGKSGEAAERFALSLAAEQTAEGHQARGVVLVSADRLDEAADAFAAALKIDPKLLDARLNRAATLRRLGRLDDAESEYRAWLDAAPADDPSRRKAQKQIELIEADRREIEKGLR